MSLIVQYNHHIPTLHTFQEYGVHIAFPVFEFSVEIYDYEQKHENDEKDAYRCAIIIEMAGSYDRSNGYEIDRFEHDIDSARELSLVKEEVLQLITLRAVRISLRGTLCEMLASQIYDQIYDILTRV